MPILIESFKKIHILYVENSINKFSYPTQFPCPKKGEKSSSKLKMIFFSMVFITRLVAISIIKIMKFYGQMRLMPPQLLSFGHSHVHIVLIVVTLFFKT